MANKQATLKDKQSNNIIPNTTTAAVADVAKNRALSASLTILVEKNALGYPTFTTTEAHAVGDKVFYDRKLWKFTSVLAQGAAWDPEKVTEFSLKEAIDELEMYAGDPRIKPLSAGNPPTEGDMLFYDRAREEYCIVKKAMIGAVVADYDTQRYETNYDTYVGTFDGKAHFAANDDAYSQNGMYQSDAAATACYYRITIDNSQAGSIEFSVASGNGTISSKKIEWAFGDTMDSIVSQFTALNQSSAYITFAALEDGSGVGLNVGGYGANTMTVTENIGCSVLDCSGLSVYMSANPSLKMGNKIDPSAAHTYINSGAHMNYRGAAASTLLTGKGLVAANASCIANTGKDYSYRCGGNFAKFKSWASTSGDATFYADGVNGTASASSGKVMKQQTFDNNVNQEAVADSAQAKMYDYYNKIMTEQTGEYAELRQELEAKYGSIESLYDAYLMCHMIDPSALTGITNSMRNKGNNQTAVKADVANVDYNFVLIPAYPPEYNAKRYGKAVSFGFKPGVYYHPEPGDIGLIFRDDIMAVINDNINEVRAAVLEQIGTPLNNSNYRGSCADYYAYTTWCFNGTYGSFNYYSRYSGGFRCRPVLALAFSN